MLFKSKTSSFVYLHILFVSSSNLYESRDVNAGFLDCMQTEEIYFCNSHTALFHAM